MNPNQNIDADSDSDSSSGAQQAKLGQAYVLSEIETTEYYTKPDELLAKNKAEVLRVIDAHGGEATMADVLVNKPITHFGRYFMASLALVQEQLINLTTLGGISNSPAEPNGVILKRLPFIDLSKDVEDSADLPPTP